MARGAEKRTKRRARERKEEGREGDLGLEVGFHVSLLAAAIPEIEYKIPQKPHVRVLHVLQKTAHELRTLF